MRRELLALPMEVQVGSVLGRWELAGNGVGRDPTAQRRQERDSTGYQMASGHIKLESDGPPWYCFSSFEVCGRAGMAQSRRKILMVEMGGSKIGRRWSCAECG